MSAAADLLGLGPSLVLAQHPDDLLLAEATPLSPVFFFRRRACLISMEFSVRANFNNQTDERRAHWIDP
jgi:hypothetical protein